TRRPSTRGTRGRAVTSPAIVRRHAAPLPLRAPALRRGQAVAGGVRPRRMGRPGDHRRADDRRDVPVLRARQPAGGPQPWVPAGPPGPPSPTPVAPLTGRRPGPD